MDVSAGWNCSIKPLLSFAGDPASFFSSQRKRFTKSSYTGTVLHGIFEIIRNVSPTRDAKSRYRSFCKELLKERNYFRRKISPKTILYFSKYTGTQESARAIRVETAELLRLLRYQSTVFKEDSPVDYLNATHCYIRSEFSRAARTKVPTFTTDSSC